MNKIGTIFHRTNNMITEDKWIVDLPNKNIPIEAKWLKSLEVKFSPPTKRADFPIFNFIAETERCIETILDRDKREMIRTKLSYLLTKCMQYALKNH